MTARLCDGLRTSALNLEPIHLFRRLLRRILRREPREAGPLLARFVQSPHVAVHDVIEFHVHLTQFAAERRWRNGARLGYERGGGKRNVKGVSG